MNPAIADYSPLARPLDLPLYSIDQITNGINSESIFLVVAPHPDDEALGCGGAIALLRSRGYNVQILVVSDGTQSHPNSQKYPAPVLKNLRETETCYAMAMLGVEPDLITFLQLPDGAVPETGELFQSAVNQCHIYLELAKPKIIFAPCRSDPHPDHRATWQIIYGALRQSALDPRVIEYPIWDWDPQQRRLLNPDLQHLWRLDISEVLVLKQQAIAAYRSQITNLIDDDPRGFRLTAQMLENFTQPWEIYIKGNY